MFCIILYYAFVKTLSRYAKLIFWTFLFSFDGCYILQSNGYATKIRNVGGLDKVTQKVSCLINKTIIFVSLINFAKYWVANKGLALIDSLSIKKESDNKNSFYN